MRAAISPRFATMSRRIATACTLCRAVTVSVAPSWVQRVDAPVGHAPCCDLRGGDSRHERVRGLFRRLRDPGRRLAPVRPRHRRGARRHAAGARARRRPRHRALGRDRGDAGHVRLGRHGCRPRAAPGAPGSTPIVTLYGTPEWANGGKGPNVAPIRGADFAAFAGAAAERYPFVHRWTIWNEPNQRRWLSTASPAQYVTRLLNPAYAAIHAASAVVEGGRRRHRSARRRRRAVPGRVHPRDGVERRPPRRLRASSVRPRAQGDAVGRRLRSLRDDHDGDARPPRHGDPEGVQAPRPPLADRARLPVESSRPAPRRRAGRAGVVHRRRRLQGLGDAARRSPDPVPLPRRADRRSLAERARLVRRRHEARDRRVRGAPRAGQPQGVDDRRVGNDPAWDRRAGVPPPAPDGRRLATRRRRAAHARATGRCNAR